jgi:AraC-like DNA-binding protein
MEVDRLYRDDTMTVAELARTIGSQEYLVRRAINGALGYRNFNDFLHRYRLDEASVRLRAEPHLPVLTIALDVGFGSIGPFNRAFRARHGCTPTQFRSAAAGAAPASDRVVA